MDSEELQLLQLMVRQPGSGKWFDAMIRAIYPTEIVFFGGEFFTMYAPDVLDPRGFWAPWVPWMNIKARSTEFLINAAATPRKKPDAWLFESLAAKDYKFGDALKVSEVANEMVVDYIRAYSKICEDLKSPTNYKVVYDSLFKPRRSSWISDQSPRSPLSVRSSSRPVNSPDATSTRPNSARDSLRRNRASPRGDGLGARRRKCLLIALYLRHHKLTLLDLAARLPAADAAAADAIRRFVRLHADTLRCVWPASVAPAFPSVVLPPAQHTAGVWAPPRETALRRPSETLSVWPPGPFASTWSVET